MRRATDQDAADWRAGLAFRMWLANVTGGLLVDHQSSPHHVPGLPAEARVETVRFDQGGEVWVTVVAPGPYGVETQEYVSETREEASALLALVPYVLATLPPPSDPADTANPDNLRAMWTGARPFERE